MERDDLTVPTYFRCPISLDVMKSPVTLSTGVTFDRPSIQRWLDDGHDTCPATMQLLPSKDLVPNRTLHRLIQIWSAESNTTGLHTTTAAAAEKCHVAELVKKMDGNRVSSSSYVDSMMNVLRFAEKSEKNRKMLAAGDNVPAFLVEALAGEGNVSVLEVIVRIVSILIGDERVTRLMTTKKSGGDYVSSLLLVLRQGSLDSKIATARVLESIASIAEVKVTITEKEEALLPELLKLTKEKESAAIEAGLSCLIVVLVPKRVKVKLVHLGAVKDFSRLLSDSKSTTTTIEKVLKLLEMVSSVKEGRAKICEEEKGGGECCVSAIVKRLLKVSTTATEHAVTILWSVCCLFKEGSAAESAVKANGLTKILLLMQSNCSPCVQQMAADLLKIFRVNSKSVVACYDTNSYYALLKNS